MKSETIKAIIGPAIVIALIIGVYFFVFRGQGNPQAAVPNQEIAQAEREILSLLFELRSISLETDLFDSAAFKSLVDFGIVLEPLPIGRENPFAPIGDVFDESEE